MENIGFAQPSLAFVERRVSIMKSSRKVNQKHHAASQMEDSHHYIRLFKNRTAAIRKIALVGFYLTKCSW